MLNIPTAVVAMVVLATEENPDRLGRTLKWLRNRWPRCQVTVIGNCGGGQYEMVARSGGATFLTRPVSEEDWQAVFCYVRQIESEVKKGKNLSRPAVSPDTGTYYK